MNSLAFGIFAGVFGIAYFMYGKRRGRMMFMGSGILLNIYPYFTHDLFWLSGIGLALLAAPFVIDH
jgi:hypothetical protein